MCGRYAAFLPPDAIAALFRIPGELPNWPPTWNMAPTRDGPVVRLHPQTGERRLDLLRWGLLPNWAKDPKSTRQPINARSDGLATSSMFRDAFARRRCLVPADAFYEWTLSEPPPDAGGTLNGSPPDTELLPEGTARDTTLPLAAPAPSLVGPVRNANSSLCGPAPGSRSLPASDPDLPLNGPTLGAAPDADPRRGSAPDTPPGAKAKVRKRASPTGKPRTPPRPTKQPWAIAREDGQPIAFAGLWEGWRGPDGTIIRSYTIVTTEANDTLRPLHERMPVVLEPADWPLWLGETDGDPGHLLRPSAAAFRVWPVGPAVNNVRNDDATLLLPAETGAQPIRVG